jgi:hypothetical protein
LISNIATGSAPLVVTSTTRVTNLNVDYANVADNINVTAPGTGTGYLVFANATTGNVAEFTSLGITSNLANNAITATTFVGNLVGAFANGNSNITITSNANVSVFTAGNATAQFVVTSTGANIPGTANIVGNVNVGNLIGPLANGNSNINMPAANGNINMSVTGNANIFVVTGTGANITGNLNVASGNITGNTAGFPIGYLNIPQSATTTTATLAIGDAGKHIYVTTTGQTITIPAASSVPYPIGTTITFIAGSSATTVSIAITTDTLRLAGSASTGTRTLAANGMATAVKVSGLSSAGVWYINGTGLT